MSNPVKPETMTDEMLVHALARFYVAERFRQGSSRISDELARFVGYNRQAVSPDAVNELARRGWLALPAAGQRVVTEVGHQRILDAINARSGRALAKAGGAP
jgi:hypothetical protein